MSYRLLQLHLSQLLKVWNKSRANKYSDSRKAIYHKNLNDLIDKIQGEELRFPTLSSTDIQLRTDVIHFVFKSIEFLDNSTLNLIPFEIIHCLEAALKDWSDKKDYIIVTSLINSLDFSFDGSFAANDDIYINIYNLYKIKFDNKLIKINIPEYLSRDYLANVVLYHELGHFIDTLFNITSVVYLEIKAEYFTSISKKDKADVELFFPFISENQWQLAFKDNQEIPSLYYHLEEYFCDIFASQYVENSCQDYLNYITKADSRYSDSHPSTVNRNVMVNYFAKNKKSYVIDKIKTATQKILGKDLQYRFKSFTSTDFENLLPVDIKQNEELHYLFIYGWNIWKSDWKTIKKNNNLQFNLSGLQTYEVINNLIEKSIGNYVIQSEWDKNVVN